MSVQIFLGFNYCIHYWPNSWCVICTSCWAPQAENAAASSPVLHREQQRPATFVYLQRRNNGETCLQCVFIVAARKTCLSHNTRVSASRGMFYISIRRQNVTNHLASWFLRHLLKNVWGGPTIHAVSAVWRHFPLFFCPFALAASCC